MAHGYLSYSPVTGEGPLGPWLYDKLEKLIKNQGKKQSKKLLNGVKDLLKKDKDTTYRNNIGKRFDVTGKRGGENTAKGGGILGASKEPKGLLAAGKGGLVKREVRESALGKNPTNSDKKEKNLLGPSGSTGRARKGGGPVDMDGAVSKGLNKDAFFQATTQGIDSSTGEYLSREDRIAKFKQGMLADRAAATGAPPITPDSGADIVAAMAKNTQAIITLVDTTEKQTQSGINIAEKQAQAQDTLFSRQKARKEEKGLEEAEDLSGFMTPEKIMKAIKPPKSKDGGGEKDGKGGGLPGMPLGGGKGLGKAARFLAPAAKWTAIIGTGILAGMSFGTHLWHQNNDKKKANAPKSDRLGNLLDDDGNVLSGPSAPTQEEQFVDNDTGERYDPPLLPVEPAKDPNNNPGYNQGGLVSGGKANLVDDVPINADEGEVVMSNRAGNMFGRDSLMSMNALAGSTNTPSSGGGYAQGGTIGVSSQSRKMYKAFGQGIVDAQLDEKKKLAEIQGEGLRNYFETKGGIEKLGEGLKGFFEGLGGAFASLFRGSPDTPGGPGDPTNVGGGGTGEQNLAAFLSTMEATGNQNQADAFQVMLNRTADAKAGGSMKAYGSTLGDQIMGKEQFSPLSAAIYGASADSAAAKKYGHITSALGGNVEERKKKLLEIASQPDGLAALQKLFGGGSASDASKVLQDFKSGGSLSQTSAKDIGSMVSFRGYSDGLPADRYNRGKGGNFFFDKGSKGKVGSLSEVSPGQSPGAGISSKEGTGMATFGETDGGSGRLRNAVGYVHGHFQSNTGTAQDVVNDTSAMVRGMLNSGLTDISISDGTTFLPSMSDGEIKGLVERGLAQHSHSGDGRSVDIFVPKGTPVPFPLTDVRTTGGGEGRNGILPGSGNTWVGHLTPDSQSGSKPSAGIAAEPDMSPAKMLASAKMPALAASSASPQTGTQMMATSAQVASANRGGGGSPTVINNYYGPGGGQQNGTPTPNSVSAGIDMNAAGLGAFQEAKLRILT